MQDIRLEATLPSMPDVATCDNPNCRVMFFHDGLVCPACTHTAKFRVIDMKYVAKETGF